ncbi:MAG: hypothetical protein Q9M24_05905 [Mariprofundaceae bacterium]|nr:hypothetical protein [Mariprofundaceae bacterium]
MVHATLGRAKLLAGDKPGLLAPAQHRQLCAGMGLAGCWPGKQAAQPATSISSIPFLQTA